MALSFCNSGPKKQTSMNKVLMTWKIRTFVASRQVISHWIRWLMSFQCCWLWYALLCETNAHLIAWKLILNHRVDVEILFYRAEDSAMENDHMESEQRTWRKWQWLSDFCNRRRWVELLSSFVWDFRGYSNAVENVWVNLDVHLHHDVFLKQKYSDFIAIEWKPHKKNIFKQLLKNQIFQMDLLSKRKDRKNSISEIAMWHIETDMKWSANSKRSM